MGVIWGIIFMALRLAWSVVWKAIKFTGAFWLVVGFALIGIFQHFTGLNETSTLGAFLMYAAVLFFIGLFLYTLAENVIRFVGVRFFDLDPSFSFKNIRRMKRAAKSADVQGNPAVVRVLGSSAPQGFVFGRKGSQWICKPETMDGHILTLGGAGSGKSSCIAIPSLQSWGQRVFAIDIKGELAAKTASRRPMIKVFNPKEPASAGYNPYYLLRGSRNPIQDAREIAQAIVPKPENTKEPFWIDNAQNLFTGAILHCFEQGHSFIDTIYTVQSTPIEQLIAEIHSSTSMDARLFVNQLVGMDIKTLAGIYGELSNKIMVFATDPDIKACLSRRDTITPEDLESGSDVYLNIPEDKLEQWKGLLTLIVNQFLKHFERRQDTEATPVLFLLDEFPRLGKVETIINGLATLRSKNVTIALFAQSLAQLDAIYGKENRQVIADNCQMKAILSATDADTQDYFSRLVGTYDKRKTSSSAQFEEFTSAGQGRGVSSTTEEKRIIKPEEFATLTDIVLLTPFGFTRVQKAPYYTSKAFTAPPAATKAATIA